MRPLVIFYIFVIYILLQFCWWTWLLVDLNKEIYEQKMKIVVLQHVDESERERESALFRKDLNKRWMMVASEGVVFFALLLIGINQTRKAFKKEFLLSRQQKNFLLSITHEFKSPLAAIKLSLQTIRKHDLDKSRHHALVDQSLRETERIQTLIENALTATQLENKSLELSRVEFNLTELVREIVTSKSSQAHQRHPVTGHLDEDVYFFGDPVAIHSVVINLVENAEKYSPDGCPIVIELKEREKHIVLRIMDEGPGIPDDEREKIFMKFYRVENEETRHSKGTGLGLYIVKTVVELHGGKVFVKPNEPAGTLFEMIFKKP
jgi:two-component system phosphate regulon sensor histidine kinase PhoR